VWTTCLGCSCPSVYFHWLWEGFTVKRVWFSNSTDRCRRGYVGCDLESSGWGWRNDVHWDPTPTYGRIGLRWAYKNLQSYWTTTKLWKHTIVFDNYYAMETYDRIGPLRSYGTYSRIWLLPHRGNWSWQWSFHFWFRWSNQWNLSWLNVHRHYWLLNRGIWWLT
jgi:hypothetical protein